MEERGGTRLSPPRDSGVCSLGGIGSLAPEQRGTLAALGLRAMLGGTLASVVTATIAGLFYQG